MQKLGKNEKEEKIDDQEMLKGCIWVTIETQKNTQ
jgi:hypothetical protein